MPKKWTDLLVMLIIALISIQGVAHGDTTSSVAKITTITKPQPYLNQLTSGDKCVFNVEVQNLGVNVAQGQIVNASDPSVKYSGNFTVEASFELRKEGVLFYGGQSVGYTTSINNTQLDQYYSYKIPPQMGKLEINLTYNLTKGYEVLGVRPDENLVLYFRVNVFVQTYSDKDGIYRLNVGQKIQTQKNLYYVIDFVKQEYLKGKLLDIKGEISQVKNINSDQVQIGKDYYAKILNDINSTIIKGDYINALDKIRNYYEFEQPKLMDILFINLNTTAKTANKYPGLKANYDALQANNKQLESDFYSVLKANQLQETNIQQLQEEFDSTKQSYLLLSIVGLALMFLVGYLIGRKPNLAF
jgi:hypothetical protein